MDPERIKNYAATLSLLLLAFMLANGFVHTWKAFNASSNVVKTADPASAGENAGEVFGESQKSYNTVMGDIKMAVSYFVLSIIPALAARRTEGFRKLKALIYSPFRTEQV